MKTCAVYFQDLLAGALVKTSKGKFYFAYYEEYLTNPKARPLSLSLPLQKESFESEKLFPFFEGLLSEGWLKKAQTKAQKIDGGDSFSLLSANGEDLIGAVKIIPIKAEES